MKKLLTVLMVTLLATSVMAMPPPATSYYDVKDPVTLMIGFKYDESMIGVIGGVVPLGAGFYEAGYSQLGGLGGTINLETMYLISGGGFYFGPLIGPNVDWINMENDGISPIAYFVGAVGFVGGYSFTQDFGIGVAAKHKFGLKEDNLYPDGYEVGLFVTINVK